ncbi:uncharacterized protein UDID_18869 [Ustilago sp. UG-2017a]|nr:uncharacterized protein UDID_18869 [Ustilago sp. UG-2017a]
MTTILREGEHKEPRYEAQNSFGLVMTGFKKEERNLNPTVQEALAGEDKRFWEEAMRKELKGLEAMNTWETTDLLRDTNTVDMCWVLKIKTDANLIPTKYKVRLVARGFTQREGIDYMEIFAPVAPIQSIRGVLAIAAVQDWEVDSIDIKQAYLNSSLHHDVYLKPPIRTKVPPGKVLKLMKGLYGLKQSGREWNIELDTQLRKIGFHCMSSAPCLYSRGTDDRLVRGRAPETQVGLSRYSATIKLCDSYCLGTGPDELIARRLSSCVMGGICCICYRRFRLASVDTPFRGGSARSISICRLR